MVSWKNMLYKKYHRNYVSQFKEEVELKLERYTVIMEPYIELNFTTRIPRPYVVVYLEDNSGKTLWTLVYSDGSINEYLHAIQKIS